MYTVDALERFPNPIFSRDGFMDLCGEWLFGFDENDVGLSEKWYDKSDFPLTIQVPFVFQSELSGIHSNTPCSVVWYKRFFEVPAGYRGKQTVLHFGAVDYEASVWVNGAYIGRHVGGYDSFDFDIGQVLNETGQNDITVRVYDDDYSKRQMRGKQLWADEPFGCWYTRYSGIWQPVWLESVERSHIKSFQIHPDIDNEQVGIRVETTARGTERLRLTIAYGEKHLCTTETTLHDGTARFKVCVHNPDIVFDGIAMWSPDFPALYSIRLELVKDTIVVDTVHSYFGMRTLETEQGCVLLNHFPFFQKLLLNQGYYPGGLVTPKDDEQIKQDICLIKSMGYNGIRIHEKVESARFLYWCDRLGLAVWEEIPSMYEYCSEMNTQILAEMSGIVKRDVNHPSIVAWVLFNESWGIARVRTNGPHQELTCAAYHMIKAYDRTRFIIGNDGWEHTQTDLCTIHDYASDEKTLISRHSANDFSLIGKNPPANEYRLSFAKGFSYGGQPVIVSEYGGISFASDNGWGYNDKVDGEEAFFERFRGLTLALKRLPYVQGYCYTQFTDVEHEQNGLVTIARIPKVSLENVRAINEETI